MKLWKQNETKGAKDQQKRIQKIRKPHWGGGTSIRHYLFPPKLHVY